MGLERFTVTGGGAKVPGAGEDLPESVARALEGPGARDTEICDLCAAPIGERHRHLVEIEERRLECACRPCALLFDQATTMVARQVDQATIGQGGDGAPTSGQYRAVPEECRGIEDFALDRRQWASLRIPVDLAFVMHNATQDRTVAFYPSPGGATESELDLESWDDVVASNPALAALESDVEALLVRRHDDGPDEAYVVPIDRCYELIGHLRLEWKGFGGGSEVRQRIDDFFTDVAADADRRPPLAVPSPVREGAR